MITRYDHRTGQRQNIAAWPEESAGWGAKDVKYRFQWTFPILISPHDPKSLLHHLAVRPPLDRRGEELAGDLARPDAQRPDQAGAVRRADHDRQQRHGLLLHDLRAGRISRAGGRSLGRLGRRVDPSHPRQRRDVDERHAPGDAGVVAGEHHRGVAARRSHRLRRHRPPPPRRLRPVPLQDERLRPNVDEDHRRHPGGRVRPRHPRRPRPARPPLCGHRGGAVRLIRRRRALAIASA